MKAVRLHAYGPADHLTYEEVPDLRPAEGEVRIDVRASGVHLIETRLRSGLRVGPHEPPTLPTIMGDEVAGPIDAVGPGVDPAWIGRRVVASLGGEGGYAEQATAPLDAVHPLPDRLDDATAVAMITTGATAMGLLGLARPTAADVVLIPSAAGGIGGLLVQAAKAAGATVVGVSGGPEKTARVTNLGADISVDYRRDDWPEQVAKALGDRAVSLAFDGVGGQIGRRTLELVGPGGRLLLHGWASGEPTAFTVQDLIERGLTVGWAIGPHLMPDGWRALETQALEQAATGALTPLITRFPFETASEAHTCLEERRAEGKVVLIR
ncbi:zinc-binding dehydrogenase [Actinomadura hibisca]|uniref:zinc-binding dehydrogenase n=1 Tax=Actinomadura hibisca TaxID=68565 RepID=UPI00082E6BD6|nr:zinc-binding dehydrogenase [Actinomadura hibisca]